MGEGEKFVRALLWAMPICALLWLAALFLFAGV
jgi:hypothetical protein